MAQIFFPNLPFIILFSFIVFLFFLKGIPLFLLFIYLFIYLFLTVLGLSFCARAFSSYSKRGPLFNSSSWCTGLSLSRPLLLHSTSSRGAGSVAVAHGPSCSAACGIFPDQGSNPCPLYWQADSQPLRHQGSPVFLFLSLKNYPQEDNSCIIFCSSHFILLFFLYLPL